MQFSEIVEYSALVVGHCGHLMTHRPIPDSALHAYWVHHRDLVNQWAVQLSELNQVMNGRSLSDAISRWRNSQSLFREILQTGILVRSWGAVLTAAGSYEGMQRSEAIARNVLMTYLDARKKCLELILEGADFDPQMTGRLNLFRLQTERWVDMLVGRLLPEHSVEDFAIDVDRANEFGHHQLQSYLETGLSQTNNPLWIQLKVMTSKSGSRLERCREQLLQSVMAMFPHSAFNSQGLLRPVPSTKPQMN